MMNRRQFGLLLERAAAPMLPLPSMLKPRHEWS